MLTILIIVKEFVVSFTKLRFMGVKGTLLFFGSARIKSNKELEEIENAEKKASFAKTSRYYEDTCYISNKIAIWLKENNLTSQYTIATGGGPGIMEAANKGAFEANVKNIGFNIKLPFEQKANNYITPALSFNYKYFFCRKYWMLHTAKVIVVCPGGFGTLDEIFETFTLLQTAKIKRKIPIIFYDEEFYKEVISFAQKLADDALISKKDLNLFMVAKNKDDAVEKIKQSVMQANA